MSNVVAAAPSSRSVDQHRASLMRRLMVGQPPGAPSAAAPPSAVTSDSELKYQFAGSAGERRDRSYSAFPGSYSVRGDSTKVSDLFQSLGGSVVPSEPDAGAGSDGATVDSSASKQAAVGATAAADGGAATLSSSTNGGLVILCVVGALVASAGVLNVVKHLQRAVRSVVARNVGATTHATFFLPSVVFCRSLPSFGCGVWHCRRRTSKWHTLHRCAATWFSGTARRAGAAGQRQRKVQHGPADGAAAAHAAARRQLRVDGSRGRDDRCRCWQHHQQQCHHRY